MRVAPLKSFLGRLCPGGGPADADLLGRYAASRDESAFAELVGRHGPPVLGVCRRVLGDAHDAEDAFQATFLVLARKCGSVRKHASLGSWPHGVAYRTALRARARAAWRRRHERGTFPSGVADPVQDLARRDLRAVLDAELDRLPSKYRTPLVLCYLEGRTQGEAAKQLGLRPGTLATRVLRGRALLRSLLERRGVALSAAGLATLAPGPVSARLVGLAVRGAGCPVPAPVEALVIGEMRSMTYSTIQRALLAAVAVTLLGAAGPSWQWGQPGVTAAPLAQKGEDPTKEDAAKKALAALRGEWQATAVEFGDLSLPKEDLAGYRFTFAGEKLTWKGPIGLNIMADGKVTASDGTYDCVIKIDSGKRPKQLDITFRFRRGDRTALGIYDLKGDTLWLYFGDGGKRPAEFSSKGDPRAGNLVLTRVKGQRTPADE